MTSTLIDTLLGITIYSGVIWAATSLFKKAFKSKMSPSLHLGVWLLFLLRLIIPVTFESSIHLIRVPREIVAQEPATPPDAQDVSAATLAEDEWLAEPGSVSEPGGVLSSGSDQVPFRGPSTISSADGESSAKRPDTGVWVLGVWIAGAGLLTAFSFAGYQRLRKDVDRNAVQGADSLHILFQECRSELGIDRRVRLAIQNDLAGPALMFPNVVLLPDKTAAADHEKLRMALLHELTHFQRRDHILSLFLGALRIVWWFNPFVWLATRQIREDIETACDNDVVCKWSGARRALYAKTVLSMFGRAEPRRAVLGMAYGGDRKNAEKRIRGIFMTRKSKKGTKLTAALLAAAIGLCCFTTACQPTPEAQAFGSLEPSSVESGRPDAQTPSGPHYEPMRYETSQQWQEEYSRDAGRFTVSADVAVQTPDADVYPVQKLNRTELSEDRTKELIEYFAPGVAEFYQLPLQMTKSDYEGQIIALRETLAEHQRSGDQDAARLDQESIDALEAQWARAPEEASRQPAVIEFGYPVDYEGNVMTEEGARFLEIAGTSDEGRLVTIRVRCAGAGPDDVNGASFEYGEGAKQTQAMDERNLELLATEREELADLAGEERAAEEERIQEQERAIQERMSAHESNTIDLETARRQAAQILADLGIDGLQITAAERALFAPHDGSGASPDESDAAFRTPVAYIELRRQSGGIPCLTQEAQSMQNANFDGMYSAPFLPEYASMVLDEKGRPLVFNWTNPVEVAETVSADSDILSFDEIKDRALQQLYYCLGTGLSSDEARFRYDVSDARLVMTYANAQDDPASVLTIPAWCVTASGEGSVALEPSEPGRLTDISISEERVIISALDGATVLMPGTAQNWHADGSAS